MLRKDYYVVLGVSRTESRRGIRAAFCALAKHYHPERIGPQGQRFFQEILTAYQVLADPAKRQYYDRGLLPAVGKVPVPQRPLGPAPEGGSVPTVPEPLPIVSQLAIIRPPVEEILEQVLKNFTRGGMPQEEPLKSFNVQVVLSPAEAARGGMARITVPVFYPCSACAGSGREGLFPCSACEAQGVIEEEETISVPIPSMVGDYTLREIPVRGLGIHNLTLRLYIRVVA
jgi:molecular chaperone DnaJ